MKLYLSSYKLGNQPERLKDLLPSKPRAIYISNALDSIDDEKHKSNDIDDITSLEALGITVQQIDLKNYFNKKHELENICSDIDLIYVSGGNVFDLRIAMKLSGMDRIIQKAYKTNMVYAGYSAGVCVLSPTLKGYDTVDNPNLNTYHEVDTIWEGLNIIDWQFAPHYKSNHHESELIEEEISYYKKHNLPFKALQDGQVIIID